MDMPEGRGKGWWMKGLLGWREEGRAVFHSYDRTYF